MLKLSATTPFHFCFKNQSSYQLSFYLRLVEVSYITLLSFLFRFFLINQNLYYQTPSKCQRYFYYIQVQFIPIVSTLYFRQISGSTKQSFSKFHIYHSTSIKVSNQNKNFLIPSITVRSQFQLDCITYINHLFPSRFILVKSTLIPKDPRFQDTTSFYIILRLSISFYHITSYCHIN